MKATADREKSGANGTDGNALWKIETRKKQYVSELEFLVQFHLIYLFLGAVPTGIKFGIATGVCVFALGIAVSVLVSQGCKFVRTRFASSEPACFLIDKTGIFLPNQGTMVHWDSIKSISWPANGEKFIRLRKNLGPGFDPGMTRIEPSRVKPEQLPLFCHLIRTQLLKRRIKETNWERYCFDRLLFKIELPTECDDAKYKEVFSKFRALGKYLTGPRKKEITSRIRKNRQLESSGSNLWPTIISAIDPASWLLLGGSISTAAIFYSWRFTGGWCAPVINMCLGFSAVLSFAGLVSWILNSQKGGSFRLTGDSTKSVLGFSIVIFLTPGLFAFLMHVNLGQLSSLILLTFLLLPLFVSIVRISRQQEQARNRYSKDAIRFFDAYFQNKRCSN